MKIDFIKQNKKQKNGFTLIETLVAIGIFAFSITALISITATGVFNTNFVKNKFTASYLAMEGAELVRNIRDTASINDRNWSAILGDPAILANCFDQNFCYIDGEEFVSVPEPELCPGDCPPLNYRASRASFNYDPIDGDNLESIFTRTINIVPVVGAQEVKVISRVTWQQGQDLRTVEYSFNLLNWAGE